jgi:hypothetical protein
MRTIDELWKAIGQICDLFTPEVEWALGGGQRSGR